MYIIAGTKTKKLAVHCLPLLGGVQVGAREDSLGDTRATTHSSSFSWYTSKSEFIVHVLM